DVAFKQCDAHRGAPLHLMRPRELVPGKPLKVETAGARSDPATERDCIARHHVLCSEDLRQATPFFPQFETLERQPMLSSRRACRGILAIAVSLVAGLALFQPTSRAARADDADDAEKQEAQSRKERFTNWMRTYAEGTNIRLQGKRDEEEQTAEMVANPVFRYSDEQRAIPDATLWVWTRNARPVAFQKVEGNNHGGGQMWTICFASLSEGLLRVRWPGARQYASRKPGVHFDPIPRSEPPAAT